MILVVGDTTEIPATIPAVHIRPFDEVPHGAFAAIVFDLRTAELSDLAVLRERSSLADLPLLLVSGGAIQEAAVTTLRADDTFVIGVSSLASLERRLVLFLELGRARRNLAERQRFERLAAMGTMVAGFAHEVRNPVAALRSLCEELRDEGVSMPHVGLMLQMVERIERLVRTSLQFGVPATPKRSLSRPAAIALSALADLAPRLQDEKIVVETEPELPDANVDERQIAQALVILLNNALDATGGTPSRVTLRVRRSRITPAPALAPLQPTIRFEVIDDGPGISEANLGRIFDPFFTTKASGTGLGLSIAQQIVNENGAHLEVDSTPGGTTSFTIILPTEMTPSTTVDHSLSPFRS